MLDCYYCRNRLKSVQSAGRVFREFICHRCGTKIWYLGPPCKKYTIKQPSGHTKNMDKEFYDTAVSMRESNLGGHQNFRQKEYTELEDALQE